MIGNHLGERYELSVLQQEGPIFTAYSAKDKVLGREVTIRILKPPFSAEYRFVDVLQEVIKRSGSVRHPNVERLIELQQDPNTVYLVSEASRGSSLTDRIQKLAPYSVPVAVGMAISILDGLEAIHNSGYVHGDIGGHNVVVQADGAARLELPGAWEAYSASETAGSVMLPYMAPYLAPELASGSAPSPPSDTYAVGVILFQLLTGRVPYPADTPVAMAMKHSTAEIPSVRSLNPAVPPSFDDFMRRALAKDSSQRYPDASKMLADLRKIEDSVRFGKAAGPISKPSSEPQEASVSGLGPSKSGTVAGSKTKVPRVKATYVKEREPRDVPIWMIVILTFFLAVVVSLIGVWYFFSMQAPKTLVVPKIIGKSREDALGILQRMNLQMRVVSEEASEKAPKDSIIDVDPEVGAQVREGGTVQVKISAGSRLVKIPDLRGKSPDDARSILQQLSLTLDRTDPIDDPRVPKGMIARQSPDPKSSVERFTRVNVWVSTGPPPDEASPAGRRSTADDDSIYKYTLTINLGKIPEPVLMSIDITDSRGTRKFYEKRHYPNDVVPISTEGYGPHATFRIYYNGVYMTTKEADANDVTLQRSNRDRSGDNGDEG